MKIVSIIGALAVAFTFSAFSQNQPSGNYYSTEILASGFALQPGVTTNLVGGNFAVNNGYVNTKSFSLISVEPITVQLVVAPNTANPGTNSFVLSFAPVLDDYVIGQKFPLATNNLITVTITNIPAALATNSLVYSIPATNLFNAHYLKLVRIVGTGTNVVNILSARVGGWQ